MLLTVRRVTGRCIVIDVAADDTVAALKAKLECATGIRAYDQLLTLCGAPVVDSATLKDLGVEHHSVVQLAIRRTAAPDPALAAHTRGDAVAATSEEGLCEGVQQVTQPPTLSRRCRSCV